MLEWTNRHAALFKRYRWDGLLGIFIMHFLSQNWTRYYASSCCLGPDARNIGIDYAREFLSCMYSFLSLAASWSSNPTAGSQWRRFHWCWIHLSSIPSSHAWCYNARNQLWDCPRWWGQYCIGHSKCLENSVARSLYLKVEMASQEEWQFHSLL